MNEAKAVAEALKAWGWAEGDEAKQKAAFEWAEAVTQWLLKEDSFLREKVAAP